MASSKWCKWSSYEDGYKCENCGYVTKFQDAIRTCKPRPSFGQRVANFIPAIAGHILAGRPKCTQEEIDWRLAICKECPLFVANTCSHENCGCAIKDTQTFFNKLYWADQECPIGKWGKVVNSGVQ